MSNHSVRLELWRRDELPVSMACSIEGCGRPWKARGWCKDHYQRWLRHGDPEWIPNQNIIDLVCDLPIPGNSPEVDLGDDSWFSGFVDGEGHFGVHHGSQGYGFVPIFAITLRADDARILNLLSELFGGNVRICKAASRANPMAHWRVNRKIDLLKLIVYFDRFPLRAKKHRDYCIWREVVLLYSELGVNAPGLSDLVNQLRDTRQFSLVAA